MEKILRRCLPDNCISLISAYKQYLSGFCATTKLIDYIKYTNIDRRQGDNKLGRYTREQCRKLMVTLETKRTITEHSLQYIQELWEIFAEEFDIPFLTAVLDNVLSGSLAIIWLVPSDIAEKIVASAHKSSRSMSSLSTSMCMAIIENINKGSRYMHGRHT